ncbi:MAG: glucose-6-phosphate isomerase [Candidatus Dormibacteria bacterium]
MTEALAALGSLRAAVEAVLVRLSAEEWARRLWARDGSLWSDDPARAAAIAGWTGWLNVAADLARETGQFKGLQDDLRAGGFTHVVLCGMGGSSLCPDVLRATFGKRDGSPELHVLDSTDPSTITGVASLAAPGKTIHVIASKSGGTLETLSHFRWFMERVRGADPEHVGHHFIAITDEGSKLEEIAHEEGFQAVFINPSDIGGRYSALSYFGMAPAAAMGLDPVQLIGPALNMAERCRAADANLNPGLELGAVLGAAANAGRDKVTLVCSPDISTFGNWLEQLLAESTGKEGKGIVPIAGEPLGPPDAYGGDRLFVHIRSSNVHQEQDDALLALRAAGQPVYVIEAGHPLEMGAEFMRWEVATAVAGAVIGIDPFDQPNVQESKDNSKAALARFLESGDFGVDPGDGAVDAVSRLLAQVREGDYFAILAYTEPEPAIDALLAELRGAVLRRHRVATTAGYGPRYLHSTGQLHKGGPASGCYLVLSDERGDELPIPGEEYGFKTLIRAQWMGDLKSLRDHGRRVEHANLGPDRVATLRRLVELAKA